MLTVVHSSHDDIKYVARNMREQDRIEIRFSSDSSPLDALMKGYRKSDSCWTVLIDGVPAVIFGVRRASICTNNAVVWMLATDRIKEVPYQFVRESRRILNRLLQSYNMVYNYVWEENVVSIQWLKWLGFEIHDPVPYGVGKAKFRRFEKRK